MRLVNLDLGMILFDVTDGALIVIGEDIVPTENLQHQKEQQVHGKSKEMKEVRGIEVRKRQRGRWTKWKKMEGGGGREGKDLRRGLE